MSRCNGKNCLRRETCERFIDVRYEKPIPFTDTLCRFDQYDSNDYYIPIPTLTDKV